MTAIICLLRGVNVGGNGLVKMSALKALLESLGFSEVQTVLQSGNAVFGSKSAALPALSKKIAAAIEENLGVKPDVMLRTPDELRQIMNRNPFPDAAKDDPSHLLVVFLTDPANPDAKARLEALAAQGERIELGTREAYIHYGAGIARSKLAGPQLEKALGTRGTGRNWNTVGKLLALAEAIQSKPVKAPGKK